MGGITDKAVTQKSISVNLLRGINYKYKEIYGYE